MVNAYKVLGLRNFAARKEILIAYRSLSKKYHPDLNQGDKFYEEKFKEIQAAYMVLSNFGQRMELDTCLRKQIEADKGTNEPSISTAPLPSEQTQQTEISPGKKTAIQNFLPGKRYLRAALYTFVTLCVAGITFWGTTNHKKNISGFTTDSKINSTSTLNESPQKNSGMSENEYAESSNYFSIYSTKEEVVEIQGKPSDSIKVNALKQVIWYYEISSVTFEDNRVVEYANVGNNLRVSYFKTSSDITPTPAFSMGSTRLDVIAAQGNPTATMRIKPLNQEIWYYGESRIAFEKGRVNEYVNSERNLKISYSEYLKANIEHRSNGSFTVDSTEEKILHAQDNPCGTTEIDAFNKEIRRYKGQIAVKSLFKFSTNKLL